MEQLHIILCILMLITGLFVVLSSNPVESVLFLILTFCNAGAMLFLYNLEFFGLIFIIIYVGAIAVLFLFVVMMLNIKLHSSFFGAFQFKNILLCSVCLLLVYIFLMNIYLSLSATFPALSNYNIEQSSLIAPYFDSFYNIDVFGQVLYNYYLVYLPLAGFILLIALVGVIALTLQFNRPKKTLLDSKQLSRTDGFLSFFYNKK